ncbi:hypothetical protein AABB02_33375 [Streptomyces rimosus]|uniref:hypothetical protein n=1 Tax=Streptomyces rimosus TaxID=1927 RepID=UPI0031E3BE32
MAVSMASAHRIEPWLARLLLRPMFIDLTGCGRWAVDDGTGLFVVSEREGQRSGSRLCHGYVFDFPRRQVLDYQAGHSAAVCRRPTGLPVRDTSTWLSSPLRLPPRNHEAVWRSLLRASACCPVRLTGQALRGFARERGQDLTPATLPSMYTAAAACLHAVAPLLPHTPGGFVLHDGERRWDLRLTEEAVKPVITAVCLQPTAGPTLSWLRARPPVACTSGWDGADA